ncbi:MAG: exo-beta-N-acetylmuramidase NamZ domain-containing protein, partial [bacterium]
AITNQHLSTIDALKQVAKKEGFTIAGIFAPEHGLTGSIHAEENIDDSKDEDRIPIYGLYGKTRRPTEAMLKNLDVLVYDIQDIGSRSYTYISTLFYVMEAAAKEKIPLIVLDRPNPINGVVVDGPMLQNQWRSIVGYINVPYCHGMTIGELALLFNEEYKIGCRLTVIPMQHWRREMSFKETELMWMPTSPHIPEASTALYYPVTGLLGELSLVNIGVGYTLPFKVVGAPWIHAKEFAKALNGQQFPGVHFEPFHFKPFFGKFSQEECHGVLITITDPLRYRPVATQYLIIGILKGLYPTQFKEAIKNSKGRKEMFCKVTGNDVIYKIIAEESNIVWKLRAYDEKERNAFLPIRRRYLLEDYGG